MLLFIIIRFKKTTICTEKRQTLHKPLTRNPNPTPPGTFWDLLLPWTLVTHCVFSDPATDPSPSSKQCRRRRTSMSPRTPPLIVLVLVLLPLCLCLSVVWDHPPCFWCS